LPGSPSAARGSATAARYRPGESLAGLLAVLGRHPLGGELAEAPLPDAPALLVRYTLASARDWSGAFLVVEPGDYLVCGDTLFTLDRERLDRWYDWTEAR
jgi:hypothetical protein